MLIFNRKAALLLFIVIFVLYLLLCIKATWMFSNIFIGVGGIMNNLFEDLMTMIFTHFTLFLYYNKLQTKNTVLM